MLTSEDIRKLFVNFWTSNPRDFKVVPNVSLVPNIDSTLLFVNSGMFPLAPFLGGQPHPSGKRLCNFQRCLRTNYDEMLEIGDNRHTMMFEMMGDWSLGDFFKKEQIPWIMELHVEHYKLDPSRLYVSVWAGDEKVPRDDTAIELWKKAFKKYGVEAEFSEDLSKLPKDLKEGKNHKYRIFPYGQKKNWWERAHAPGELGGPTSEIFYDLGKIQRKQDKYHINDDSGRFIEIGNNVFMEYKLNKDMKWEKLPQQNVDFGGGFERIVMCIQGKTDIFETDIYAPILEEISKISEKEYKNNGEENEFTSAFRVIADHARAATFILADGIRPSNKDQGYILRRFIRRMVRFAKKLEISENFSRQVATAVIERMQEAYPHLKENGQEILAAIEKEEKLFRQTLERGLKELEKVKAREEKLTGGLAFYIYETYGFPLELTLDEFDLSEKEAGEIMSEFNEAEKKHREKSRLGAEKKFKGGLADHSEEVIKLHTAHHLLLRALQIVLGDNVKQKGSNITAERLRIDFNYGQKLDEKEISEIQRIVNDKINADLTVVRREMPREEAEKLGAQMEFGQKYPDVVSVYLIKEKNGEYFSKEFCGGPHVKSTGDLSEGGRKFIILSQENIGGGLRRIKAALK